MDLIVHALGLADLAPTVWTSVLHGGATDDNITVTICIGKLVRGTQLLEFNLTAFV